MCKYKDLSFSLNSEKNNMENSQNGSPHKTAAIMLAFFSENKLFKITLLLEFLQSHIEGNPKYCVCCIEAQVV